MSPQTNRHSRRAAIADRLVARAPAEAAALDWDALDEAPDWLGLPDDALGLFARRVGAVVHAPAMKFWIDHGRIAAARAAVGEQFLRRLVGETAGLHMPRALAGNRPIPNASAVAPALEETGASVLLATVPEGPLARAAAAALGAVDPAEMIDAHARSTIAKALALSADEVA